jgi:hypothetical protein
MTEQELFGFLTVISLLLMLYSIPYISSYIDDFIDNRKDKKDKQAH